jgi:ubiquinone/menaquinone biosynthesis C-methylase UbiE
MKNHKYTIKYLKYLYDNGYNISTYLMSKEDSTLNSVEAVRIAYDFQSGEYINFYMKDKTYSKNISILMHDLIASTFNNITSILDVGCGELTNTMELFKLLDNIKSYHAIDCSLSRLIVGREFLRYHDVKIEIELSSCEISCLPYRDNSIDLIVSHHALEPNRGREKEIITELLRVSRMGLVLLEPDYENSSNVQKARMDKLGYIRGLRNVLADFDVEVQSIPVKFNTNKSNIPSIFVVRKRTIQPAQNICYVDPINHFSLTNIDGYYFSEEQGLLYPIVKGIPNFDSSTAIICSKFLV